jgi:GT2 family glycosyltransferase
MHRPFGASFCVEGMVMSESALVRIFTETPPEAKIAGALTTPSVSLPLRIAVIVASIRRAEEIGQLLTHLSAQSFPPSAIILSVEGLADLPCDLPAGVEIVMGQKGLTRQRNRGLERALPRSDVVVFFDDDFIPEREALAGMAKLFEQAPDIVGATGLVLRDGVKLGGISYEDAAATVRQHEAHDPVARPLEISLTSELYGCNMAFRSDAIGALRFDESLPLYGWQEDVDFTGQIMRCGYTVKTNAFAGVHRGVNKGRTRGVPLGYSQMVNPVYLVRKGTMHPTKALRLMIKNFLANHGKLLRPEPFIDRAGRCQGNWRGIFDLLRGRCDPEAVLTLT